MLVVPSKVNTNDELEGKWRQLASLLSSPSTVLALIAFWQRMRTYVNQNAHASAFSAYLKSGRFIGVRTENLNGRASSLQVVDVSRVDSNGVVIIRSSNNNSSRQLSVACNRDQKRFKVPQNNVYDDPLHLPKMNSNSSETLSRNKSED